MKKFFLIFTLFSFSTIFSMETENGVENKRIKSLQIQRVLCEAQRDTAEKYIASSKITMAAAIVKIREIDEELNKLEPDNKKIVGKQTSKVRHTFVRLHSTPDDEVTGPIAMGLKKSPSDPATIASQGTNLIETEEIAGDNKNSLKKIRSRKSWRDSGIYQAIKFKLEKHPKEEEIFKKEERPTVPSRAKSESAMRSERTKTINAKKE